MSKSFDTNLKKNKKKVKSQTLREKKLGIQKVRSILLQKG